MSHRTPPIIYLFNINVLKSYFLSFIHTSAALIAAFLCLHFAVPAYSADPTCLPFKRGVFNDVSQTFSRNSQGNDYLIECTGNNADIDDAKIEMLFEAAATASSADNIDYGPANARLIVKLNNASLSADVEDSYPSSDDPKGGYVLDGSNIKFYRISFPDELAGALKIDTYGTVVTGGTGKGGIRISVEDATTDHKVTLRNFGRVTTDGDGTQYDGVEVYSQDADVEGHNEASGRISTTGDAARGLFVISYDDPDEDSEGNALAVNRGSITTTGDPTVATSSGENFLRRSYGVFSYSDRGNADIKNYGTVTTSGTGARGLNAYVASGDGSASIWNHGTVTTTGAVANMSSLTGAAEGVRASADGTGDADAVNESTGTVTTEGVGAAGLTAYAKAGNANVVNRGIVKTSGGTFKVGTELNSRPLGIYASVWGATGGGDADAQNRGTVTTSGVGARAVSASTENVSGTAMAVNHGTITTTGGVVHDDDSVATADGVAASTKGSGTATATNESTGTINVSGDGAKGVWALVYDEGTGNAIATNKGSITTRGNVYFADRTLPAESSFRTASGVASYTDGTGSSTAINAAGGTVATHGTGSIGVIANADGAGGNAVAENRGTVTTSGGTMFKSDSRHSALGVYALATGGNAQATNRGTITTTGVGAVGVAAESESTAGTATAINHGTVTTTGGTQHDGDNENVATADGVFASTDGSGAAIATNESTGTVSVSGAGAKGVRAEVYGTGDATATNKGTVTTRGDLYFLDRDPTDSYRAAGGVAAFAQAGGDATALNDVGGTVTTHGTGAAGVIAWTTHTDGDAVAENRGTVRTTATTNPDVTNPQWSNFYTMATKSHGVAAVSEMGNAQIKLTGGTVTVSGEASGLFAMTAAEKTITVDVTNGAQVTGETAARFVGGRATVTMMGEEARKNILRGAVHFGDKRDRLLLRFSEIYGDISFGQGRDRLQLNGGAVIQGDIDFGEDTGAYVTLSESDSRSLPKGCLPDSDKTSQPHGDVLLISVSERNAPTVRVEGEVSNVNRFCKRGKGAALLQKGISFKGSQALIEDGLLILGGHMDLGDSGTLTVLDRAALRFQVGDIPSKDYGRVTAKSVTFEDDDSDGDTDATPNLQVAKKTGASFDETGLMGVEFINAESILNKPQDEQNAKALTGTLSFMNKEGETVGTAALGDASGGGDSPRKKLSLTEVDVSKITLERTYERTPVNPPSATTGNGSGSGGGSGGGGIVAIGGIALIIAMLNRNFDLEPTDESEETAAELVVTEVDPEQYYHFRRSGFEFWARSFQGGVPTAHVAGTQATAEGWSFGINTRLDRGFWAGISVTPEVSMAALNKTPDSRVNTLFIGNSRAIHGGYKGDEFFARATMAEGVYDALNSLIDPMSAGTVAGVVKVRHRQAKLTAGLVQNIGRMRVVPKVSWFTGQLDGGRYEADNSLMLTAVPATTHSYRGWGGELSLASRGWLSATGSSWSWRPQLNLTAHHLRATGFVSEGQLRYSDRAGITNFNVPAKASELPRSVMGVFATMNVMQSKATNSWRFKAGYGGAMVDGEYYHAVVFGAQRRF